MPPVAWKTTCVSLLGGLLGTLPPSSRMGVITTSSWLRRYTTISLAAGARNSRTATQGSAPPASLPTPLLPRTSSRHPLGAIPRPANLTSPYVVYFCVFFFTLLLPHLVFLLLLLLSSLSLNFFLCKPLPFWIAKSTRASSDISFRHLSRHSAAVGCMPTRRNQLPQPGQPRA